jgi:hypothetical protein
MKSCTVYTFNAPNRPGRIVKVVMPDPDDRLSPDATYNRLMIFPQKWMADHPECTGVRSITCAHFVDDER